MANYHPDWQIEAQFLTLDLHRVMDLDSTANSHPIVQEVNHPDQITEIFDTISYSKGASVLRMLEQFLGPELFRQGVSIFLAKFQYSNAVTADLWAAMEEVSEGGLDIRGIMDTWTRQMGYPVLQVSLASLPPSLPPSAGDSGRPLLLPGGAGALPDRQQPGGTGGRLSLRLQVTK